MSNVSVETLEKLREDMVGRRYKHFKGRIYIVNDIAVHTESDQKKFMNTFCAAFVQ